VDKQEIIRALNSVYRIVEAGEKGFATAATNIHRPGIKVMLKSYAQQRALFKEQIEQELARLDSGSVPGSSILGIIHRGRVAIFAAMTIEDDARQRVILKEAALGERYARDTYERVLKHDLPPETRALLEQQYVAVRAVDEHIDLMRGANGKRQLVRLFSSEANAQSATQAVKDAGVPAEAVEKIPVSRNLQLYRGVGFTTLETGLSGAFGGALWGGLAGLIIGLGVAVTPVQEQIGAGSILATWALLTFIILLIGAVIGVVLGLVIGVGIHQDDQLLYERSTQDGQTILRVLVAEHQAHEIDQILDLSENQAGLPAWASAV
jgi:uncharacterized protein (TIGR02284 family)